MTVRFLAGSRPVCDQWFGMLAGDALPIQLGFRYGISSDMEKRLWQSHFLTLEGVNY